MFSNNCHLKSFKVLNKNTTLLKKKKTVRKLKNMCEYKLISTMMSFCTAYFTSSHGYNKQEYRI